MEEPEYEVSHTCQEIEDEKQRYHDIGFIAELSVDANTDDGWEVMLHLFDRLGEDEKLISINSIEITFCPFCGTRLPDVKGS